MYTQATILGVLAAIAVGLAMPAAPTFTLESTGAVRVSASGHEARYGIVPQAIRGGPILTISLGEAGAEGALHLSVLGERLPAPGRYRVRPSWDEGEGEIAFHASFMPGTAERPLGWYHGDSGWVTVTESGEGRIAGTFEIRGRGFGRDDPADAGDRWVTVRGRFEALGG
jgi:hypothetical protein